MSELALSFGISLQVIYSNMKRVSKELDGYSDRLKRTFILCIIVNCLIVINAAAVLFRSLSYLPFMIMMLPNIVDFHPALCILSRFGNGSNPFNSFSQFASSFYQNVKTIFGTFTFHGTFLFVMISCIPYILEAKIVLAMCLVNVVVVSTLFPAFLYFFKPDSSCCCYIPHNERPSSFGDWSLLILRVCGSLFVLKESSLALLHKIAFVLLVQKYPSRVLWAAENFFFTSLRLFSTPVKKNKDLLVTNEISRSTSAGVLLDQSLAGVKAKSDEEILHLISIGLIQFHNIEKHVADTERAVLIRRKFLDKCLDDNFVTNLSYKGLCYDKIHNQCCENVIGYVEIPVGVVGPIPISGVNYYVPMATTEGCLVASTSRGASCVRRSGGIVAALLDDGITRAPVLRVKSLSVAIEVKNWVRNRDNFTQMERLFNCTSRFARLLEVKCTIAGCFVYLRFKSTSGNAMGMNMISRGVEACLSSIRTVFGDSVDILSLSGNYCCDKKPAAINWIEGRGKSVVCEAVIPGMIVREVLRVTPERMVEVNISKCLVGSAVAGSLGGFNSNASNTVAAIFVAAGQDIAQVVESSHCLTYMELRDDHLYVSCTMPCIEVGTIGGGTMLTSQRACLDILGLDRSKSNSPAANLAMVACGAVLCTEVSLLASLCEGTLVKSHLNLNRGHARASLDCKVA